MTVGTGAQFEIPEAQCFFGDEYAGWVSSLTKGSTVMLSCTVEGLMMNVLMKNCSGIAGTDTLNACHKLQGIARLCSPQNNSTTAFYTSDAPAGGDADATVLGLDIELCLLRRRLGQDCGERHTSPTTKAWVERSVGFIYRLRDEVDGEQALAQVRNDAAGAGLGRVVGSASARVAMLLPSQAPPDLEARVKTVIDRLAPAFK